MDGYFDPETGEIAPGDEFDPNRIAHQLETLGTAWANAKAAADLLEETKGAVLSELTNQERASGDISRREAEDRAKASPIYREHLTLMVDTRRQANIARALYDAARARSEAMRTREATKRAAMFAHR